MKRFSQSQSANLQSARQFSSSKSTSAALIAFAGLFVFACRNSLQESQRKEIAFRAPLLRARSVQHASVRRFELERRASSRALTSKLARSACVINDCSAHRRTLLHFHAPLQFQLPFRLRFSLVFTFAFECIHSVFQFHCTTPVTLCVRINATIRDCFTAAFLHSHVSYYL